MVWAKGALVCGLLVLLAAFALGTERQLSTSIMGRAQDCGPSISAPWLVSGTPGQATALGSASRDDERRTAAACSPVVRESREFIGVAMGTGGLLALVGWTAIRTPRDAEPTT